MRYFTARPESNATDKRSHLLSLGTLPTLDPAQADAFAEKVQIEKERKYGKASSSARSAAIRNTRRRRSGVGGVVKLTAEEAAVNERDFVGVMRRTSMHGTVYETSHSELHHYGGDAHEEKVAEWDRQAHVGGSRGHGEHDKQASRFRPVPVPALTECSRRDGSQRIAPRAESNAH